MLGQSRAQGIRAGKPLGRGADGMRRLDPASSGRLLHRGAQRKGASHMKKNSKDSKEKHGKKLGLRCY